MGKINSVKKLTDNKFVNLYGVDATSVHDTPVSYFVASRAKCVEDLKLSTASFCTASWLLRLNSFATRSITSPLAPQPKQKK